MRITEKMWFLGFSILLLGCIMLNMPLTVPIQPNQYEDTEFDLSTQVLASSDTNAFISVWNTSKSGLSTPYTTGSSDFDQVRLPLESSGTYNFLVKWGDGNEDIVTSWNQAEVTHTYASEGVYIINITGTIIGWRFDNEGDNWKILEIQQWGCLHIGNSGEYFHGCVNLDITATDILNLTGTTSFYSAFSGCLSLIGSDSMNNWDVSNVTNMINMFSMAFWFNSPLGDWNVSSVTDMQHMFWGAHNFNQAIGDWDVSSVTDMNGMFVTAQFFNQPIGNWDVSSVTDMNRMFRGAAFFNLPIGNWDVSSVTDMSSMFDCSLTHSSFNQPLSNWDVSSVTDMERMFYEAMEFDQDIGTWDVSSVTDMGEMFYGVTLSTSNYNDLLNGWSQLPLQTSVVFDAGNSKYTNAAKEARETIITNFSWTIIDGGFALFIPGYNVAVLIGVLSLMGISIIRKNFPNNELNE